MQGIFKASFCWEYEESWLPALSSHLSLVAAPKERLLWSLLPLRAKVEILLILGNLYLGDFQPESASADIDSNAGRGKGKACECTHSHVHATVMPSLLPVG